LVSEKKSFLRERDKIGKYSFTRERDGEHIFVTTAKKFKGLEGKVIIIIDIDRNSFNDDQQKRNFYVACSRATHRLSLFINADVGGKVILPSLGKDFFTSVGKQFFT
jgi:DNA helicase IV